MTLLPLSELEARWADIEAAVDATGGIDHWCSGPDWVLPVARGFAPNTTSLALASDDGFALCAVYESSGGPPVIAGLEPLWGFAFPLLGPNPIGVARGLIAHIADRDDWEFVVLPGAPGPSHPLTLGVATELSRLGDVRLQEGITRQVADLSGGFDHWLERRSAKFRRNLRRTERAATRSTPPLSIEDASTDQNLFERILAIEKRSWKGQQDSGITSPEMATMYASMIERLQARSRLQAHIARREEADGSIDIGYILGGVRNRHYRGLQLSYAADTQAAVTTSIGHLLQHHQLKLLCDHDLADRYDMGMDFDYKRRWADLSVSSTTIVMARNPDHQPSPSTRATPP